MPSNIEQPFNIEGSLDSVPLPHLPSLHTVHPHDPTRERRGRRRKSGRVWCGPSSAPTLPGPGRATLASISPDPGVHTAVLVLVTRPDYRARALHHVHVQDPLQGLRHRPQEE